MRISVELSKSNHSNQECSYNLNILGFLQHLSYLYYIILLISFYRPYGTIIMKWEFIVYLLNIYRQTSSVQFKLRYNLARQFYRGSCNFVITGLKISNLTLTKFRLLRSYKNYTHIPYICTYIYIVNKKVFPSFNIRRFYMKCNVILLAL